MADEVMRDERELQEEIARLRAESDLLRSRYRVEDAPPQEPGRPPRPVRVLLLPDPLTPRVRGRPGPEAAANVARALISSLRERQPGVEWRAEHDLSRIPDAAECFQVGQVLHRMWDGTGPLPMTFRVERSS